MKQSGATPMRSICFSSLRLIKHEFMVEKDESCQVCVFGLREELFFIVITVLLYYVLSGV